MASPVPLAALQPFGIDHMPPALRGGVAAIGNFDGVHRGHAALIAAAKREAARKRAPALVLTFDPHPRSVLRPGEPLFRLTPLPAQARLMQALAVDGLAVAPFDRALAALSADEFIDRVLVGQMAISGAVVGFNFRFGKGRAGSTDTLAEAGARNGFSVTVVEPVADLLGGAVIASSEIRTALTAGAIDRANNLLGYRWFVIGRVERGEARGRQLGFPTLNLRLPPGTALRHGIYAVRVQLPGPDLHEGVASFGVRPTFGGGEPLLEAHLFDFSGDLYGLEVAIAFVDWIRPEAKFSTVADLIAAIASDAAAARAMLRAAGPGSVLDQRLAALS